MTEIERDPELADDLEVDDGPDIEPVDLPDFDESHFVLPEDFEDGDDE